MVDPELFKKLKKGDVQEIKLLGEYILRSNDHNQVYLTRGGKKHYYLTDTFIKHFFIIKKTDETV